MIEFLRMCFFCQLFMYGKHLKTNRTFENALFLQVFVCVIAICASCVIALSRCLFVGCCEVVLVAIFYVDALLGQIYQTCKHTYIVVQFVLSEWLYI